MIEHALEACITRMRLEGASPEECLAHYPEYRAELEPLLKAALSVGSLESLEPRPEFRSQTRTRLLAHMRANPRRQQTWHSSLAFRYAASLALLFVALATTGTALAQNALPGDTLYGWKLASERIWRSLHDSPVDLDIYLTGRRVDEITIIQGRANLEEIGVGAYTAMLQQLNRDLATNPDKAGNVNEVLLLQRQALEDIFKNSKGNLPDLDEIYSIVEIPEAGDDATPADEDDDTGGQLPAVVTAVPSVNKKEEGGSGAPDDEGDSSDDSVGSESEEEPGLIEGILDGLFGGK